MISFVEEAKKLNLSSLILNPNEDSKHCTFVWNKFFSSSKCPAKYIFIIAHSAGGWACSKICKNNWDFVRDRVKGIFLTDSMFEIPNLTGNKEFADRVFHYRASDAPAGKLLQTNYNGIKEFSAGHPKHEYASGCAFPYIFHTIEQLLKQI